MGETDRPARRPVVHRLSYVNVRGADGRLLFRYDPERSLVEIRVRGQTEVVDLTQVGTAQREEEVEAQGLDVERPNAPGDPIKNAGRWRAAP